MSKSRKLKRVVIKEELVALTGKINEAIVLNQMIYWSERVKDSDKFIQEELERARKFADGSEETLEDIKETLKSGWIYKTSEEMAEETMLGVSARTIDRVFKNLVDNGWLDRRKNPKYKWDKTWQYRVNLNKIQSDLLKLGYNLDGYSLPNFDENNGNNSNSDKPEDQDDDPIGMVDNDISKRQNGESKRQNDGSKRQNGESKRQNDGAIPEITTKTTSEINTEDLKQNLNHMNQYIWQMKLPMPLKKFFSDKVKDLVNDTTFDITEIEYFYNTYIDYIQPHCTREDTMYLNDIEFTKVIKKMYQTVSRPITNMEGLIKTWVQAGIHYKIENNKEYDLIFDNDKNEVNFDEIFKNRIEL